MFHYYNALTPSTGLSGYYARVIDPATLAVVAMYADESSTPIATQSGVANMAKSDDAGNYSFYVDPGTYHLDIYGRDAATFLTRIRSVAMTSGEAGPTGPANSTYATKAAMKAAPFTNKSFLLATSGLAGYYAALSGNYTGLADDATVVVADDTAVTSGALVRVDTMRQQFPTAQGGTDGLGVVSWADAAKGRFFYGGTDATPQNDEGGFWTVISSASGTEGLNRSPNPSDQGVYSFGWGRNSIGYASYSYAIGHDNIAFGVGSLAGGAGSVTGDNAHPLTGVASFYGYCSFAWGKVCEAKGQSSVAMGERASATSRSAIAFGYSAIAKGSLGAFAAGNDVQASAGGSWSGAIGMYLRNSGAGASNIGTGVNPGSPSDNPMTGSLGFGVNVLQPTVYLLPGASGDSYTGFVGSRSGWRSLLDNGGSTNINAGVFFHELENSASGGTTNVSVSGRDAGTVREFLNVKATGVVKVNGVQILKAALTGWSVDTGTAKRTANATYVPGTTLTYSATYVQAEQTALATRLALVEAALRDATQTIKALKDDLHSTAGHGLIKA